MHMQLQIELPYDHGHDVPYMARSGLSYTDTFSKQLTEVYIESRFQIYAGQHCHPCTMACQRVDGCENVEPGEQLRHIYVEGDNKLSPYRQPLTTESQMSLSHQKVYGVRLSVCPSVSSKIFTSEPLHTNKQSYHNCSPRVPGEMLYLFEAIRNPRWLSSD